jgi:hypothetical protein
VNGSSLDQPLQSSALVPVPCDRESQADRCEPHTVAVDLRREQLTSQAEPDYVALNLGLSNLLWTAVYGDIPMPRLKPLRRG